MDWNWLFSSIAQSTAAIAGIFGAFTVTKILNNQSQFVLRRSALHDAILQSERLGDSAILGHIAWLRGEIDGDALHHRLAGLLDQAEGEEELSSAQPYYEQIKWSGFSKKAVVIESIQKLIEKKKEAFKKEGIERYLSKGARTVGADYWPDRNRKCELIRQYILDVQHQMRQNRLLLLELKSNPESSSMVTYSILSILVLFYVGVIYPLSFLPLPEDVRFWLTISAFWEIVFSPKGFILCVVSTVFTALLAVFMFVNWKLRYAKEELDRLASFTALENYNALLANVVANKHLAPEIGLSFNPHSEEAE